MGTDCARTIESAEACREAPLATVPGNLTIRVVAEHRNVVRNAIRYTEPETALKLG